MAKKRKSPNRQTGRSSMLADKRKKAKSPGKRLSKSGSVYYERRKNRSDKPGSLTGIVKLHKLPKKPKASAPTKVLQNYVGRCTEIERENKKRIDLARKIKSFNK